MSEKVDPKIYEHPEVIKCMAKVDERQKRQEKEENDPEMEIENSGAVWALFARVPWKVGTEPILFINDERLTDCVEIYNPEDGKLCE